MRAEYIKLIADFDASALSSVRKLWMEAAGTEKDKWRKRIDELLDERLRLMRARDACAA